MNSNKLNLIFIGIALLFQSFPITLSATNKNDNIMSLVPVPVPKTVQISYSDCSSLLYLVNCNVTVTLTDCPQFSCPATSCTNLWVTVYDWDGSSAVEIDRQNYDNKTCTYTFPTFSIENTHWVIVNIVQSGTSCGSPWNNTPQQFTPGTIGCNRSFCGN